MAEQTSDEMPDKPMAEIGKGVDGWASLALFRKRLAPAVLGNHTKFPRVVGQLYPNIEICHPDPPMKWSKNYVPNSTHPQLCRVRHFESFHHRCSLLGPWQQ